MEIKNGNAEKMMPSSVYKKESHLNRLSSGQAGHETLATEKKSTQTRSAWSAYLQRP
jgi:hypothetical protein